MNTTGMIQNREYVETQHAIETKVNKDLVQYANKFYKETLTKKQEMELLSMSLDNKLWLLDQYKYEVSYSRKPDFDHLY